MVRIDNTWYERTFESDALEAGRGPRVRRRPAYLRDQLSDAEFYEEPGDFEAAARQPREREGKRLPANVHDDLVGGAERLASVLRARGVRVDGVVEVPGEDHGTVKFALVSRGLMWLARRATRGAAPYDEMT